MMRRSGQLGLVLGAATIILLVTFAVLGMAAPRQAAAAITCDQCADPAGGSCFTSIQAAINAAGPSQTVCVVQGTYHEHVTINKQVELMGGFQDGSLATRSYTMYHSVVSGDNNGVVINVTNGAEPVVDGLRILYGDATNSDGRGGGIRIYKAGGTFRNNYVGANVGSSAATTAGAGGGMAIMTSTNSVLIENNVFSANVAYSATMPAPAGMYFGAGGGLDVSSDASAVVRNNEFHNNLAVRTNVPNNVFGFGGGISSGGDAVEIDDNTFRGNWANATGGLVGFGGNGGALSLHSTPVLTITDNTIIDNTAALSGTQSDWGGGAIAGGGILIAESPRVYLVGNRVEDNTALVQAAASVECHAEAGGVAINGDGAAGNICIVSDNQIVGNVAAKSVNISNQQTNVRGGGLLVTNLANANIIDNLFQNNIAVRSLSLTAGFDGGAGGGGMDITDVDSAVVNGNVFDRNTANLGLGSRDDSWGGGLFVNHSTATIERNMIVGNRMNPNHSGGAGGVWIWESDVTSTNDVFAHNFSAIGGGNNSSVVLVNDTLYDNHGQGAYIQEGSTMLVSNTIVYSHDNGLENSALAPASTLIESYNLVSNINNFNGAVTHGGHTLLNQNPQFSNAASDDFHLLAGSPAINVANDAWAPPIDFDAVTRPQGGRSDIGAFEHPFVCLPILLKN